MAWAGLSLAADGVVLKKEVEAEAQEVRMPDQRAALAWEDGEERLVIETRFVGRGDRFAWLVPLPSVPRIEAVTPGFFPTLTRLSAPKAIHDPAAWWGWCWFLGALFWLVTTVRRTGSMTRADWVAVFSLGAGALGMSGTVGAMTAVLLWGFGGLITSRIRRGGQVYLILLLAGMISGMIPIPAGTSGSQESVPAGKVEVVESSTVGIFETAVLRGTNTQAVREWLETRGFSLPAGAEPVLGDHFRSGGVVVASQLRNDLPGDAVRAIHPLKFTFPTPRPVYPMRLTGTATPKLELDLYVFGPGTAEIDALDRLSSIGTFRFNPESNWPTDMEDVLPVGHPGLASMVGGAPWFTHLRGTLTGGSLLHDMEPRWTEPVDQRWIVWSRRGAAVAAVNWTSFGAAAAFAVLALRLRSNPSSTPQLASAAKAIAIASAIILCGLAFLRPTVPVIPKKSRKVEQMEEWIRFERIGSALEVLKTRSTPIDAEAVRKATAEALGGRDGESDTIRELDAPGQHTIEVGTNRISVLVFDRRGGFQRFGVPMRP